MKNKTERTAERKPKRKNGEKEEAKTESNTADRTQHGETLAGFCAERASRFEAKVVRGRRRRPRRDVARGRRPDPWSGGAQSPPGTPQRNR